MGKLKKKKKHLPKSSVTPLPTETHVARRWTASSAGQEAATFHPSGVGVCMYGLLTTDAPLIRIGRGDSIRSGSARGWSGPAKPSPGPGKLKSRPRPKDRNAANQSAIVNRTVSRDYELTALPPPFLGEGKGCTEVYRWHHDYWLPSFLLETHFKSS